MTDPSDARDGEEYYPEFRTVRRGYDPEEVEQVLDELYASLNDAVQDAEARAAALRAAEEAREEAGRALREARARIADLESRPSAAAPASFDDLGSRIADILNAATTEAAQITRRARDEARAVHDESAATVVTSRAEIDHYASDLRATAEAQAQAVREAARAEADRLLSAARAQGETQHRADVETSERAAAEAEDIMAAARRAAAEVLADAHRDRQQASELRAQVRTHLADVRDRLAAALAGVAPPSPDDPAGRTDSAYRAKHQGPAPDPREQPPAAPGDTGPRPRDGANELTDA